MSKELWLNITNGPLPSSHRIGPGRIIIVGRSKKCDIALDAHSLSRVHAKIQRTGDMLSVRDLGSTNGTFVNGECVQESVLAVGDSLRLDGVAMEIADHPKVDEDPTPKNDEADGADALETERLTPIQARALILLSQDYSEDELATRLRLDSRATRALVNDIHRVLGVHSHSELMALSKSLDGRTGRRSSRSGKVKLPRWDKELRQLWVGSILVKEFKEPAPNQEAILDAFQKQGWPSHISNPLPLEAGVHPKKRLHDTIKRLNRNQTHQLIHFYGDGTGQGICWRIAGNAVESAGAI